jgi:hypothetical protein
MQRRTILLGGSALIAGGALASSFARMGSSDSYDAAMRAIRRPLERGAGIKEAIRFATLAANGHNTQPWRFRVSEKSVAILPEFARRTPVVDPDDHHLFTSLGCAAANLSLAAHALGRPGELRFDSAANAIVFHHSNGAESPSPLLDAIPLRQSARAEFNGQSVKPEELVQLEKAAKIEDVDLVLLTARPQIDRVRDLLVAGNTAQLLDRNFVAELKRWLRFNPRDAAERGDGLYSASSGNPVLPRWLGSILYDLFFTAGSENERYVKQMNS